MKKTYRIKKNSEIDAIFNKKQSKSDSCFSVYWMNAENENHFRFAISIGRKFGNAVMRNKIKRQIRMIIHQLHDEIQKKVLFVIVVKPKANGMTYQEIKALIQTLLIKSKILENKNA